MKILFIGGTGNISKVCVDLAVARGHDVTLLNRGKRGDMPGTRQIVADLEDRAAVGAALGSHRWDVVADFIIFTPEQLEQRINLFRGRVGQFIFISSGERLSTAGQSLPGDGIDATCESILGLFAKQNRGGGTAGAGVTRGKFPGGDCAALLDFMADTVIPLAVTMALGNISRGVDRLRRGKPMIVPGGRDDRFGAMTHNTDFAKGFVGLFGNPAAVGARVSHHVR